MKKPTTTTTTRVTRSRRGPDNKQNVPRDPPAQDTTEPEDSATVVVVNNTIAEGSVAVVVNEDTNAEAAVVNDTNAESLAASAAAIALSALNNNEKQTDSSNIQSEDTTTDVEAQIQRQMQMAERGEVPLVYSIVANDHHSLPKEISRKNKQKVETAAKDYIEGEPTELDVLMGRGGRSNHHPGNARYLQEKLKIQARYRAASKEEKTGISQELVDTVQHWGGRFLKLDGDKWFKVDNTTARKKASQTLREDNTPEYRAKKRAKYAANTPIPAEKILMEATDTKMTEAPASPIHQQVVVQEASV